MSDCLVLSSGSIRVELEVLSQPGLAGVLVDRRAGPELASRHVETVAIEVADGGPEQLTRDVPYALAEATAHLDADGVVVEGAHVRPGDILVGMIDATGRTVDPEHRLRRMIHGDGPRDASLRCPADVRGTVTAVRREARPKGGTRIEVEVTETRPLRVGDVLAIGGAPAVVAALVDGLGGDLAWGGAGGRLTVEKRADAEGRLEARAIGPYSLVTQQPLGGKAQLGGQRVTPAQVRALEAGGAWHAAHELATLKCDDVSGRVRLYETLVRDPSGVVAPSTVETREVLFRELEGLGLVVEPIARAREAEGAAGGVRDIFSFFEDPAPNGLVGLRLGLASSEHIRDRSHGRVRRPETLDYRTLEPVRDGLFCARIFGPVKDYACLCGKYARMKHRGMVCEVCGVEVIQSKVRRARFGHVELPVPLLHPWAHAAVASRLDRSEAVVARIVDERLTLDLRVPENWREGGAAALRAALGEDGAPFFLDAWPVIPPDLRPIVPLAGGRFATSDLNDLYRRLINRANRIDRLIELGAPSAILHEEAKLLQAALEQLVQNGARELATEPATGPEGRPLVSLSRLVAAHLREPVAVGKRADYSGAAVAVVVPELADGAVRLPRAMAVELFRPWVYGRLERLGYVTTIKSAKRMVERGTPEAAEALETGASGHPALVCARDGDAVAGVRIELWDELAIGMSRGLFDALRLAPGDSAVVHVPATGAAVREVRGLGVVRATEPDPPPLKLVAEAIAARDLATVLYPAALRREVDPLSHPHARRLLGLIGREDADAQPDGESTWDAPAPPPPDPARSPALDRHVSELALSDEVASALHELGLTVVGRVVRMSEAEMLKTRRFGRRQLRELKEALDALGLRLGMEVDGWRDPH